MKAFTIKEANFIAANYLVLNDRAIADNLNRKKQSIKDFRTRNGLIKPLAEKKPVAEKKPRPSPPNKKPTGSFCKRHGYTIIKLESGKWVLHHRHLWEQVNGKIPRGLLIVFRNNDKSDVRIENLVMIKRRFKNESIL